MTLEEARGAPIDVFVDNWRAVNLFCALSTQWRHSWGGPTGLDYTVLYAKLDRMKLSDDEYLEFEWQIRVLEDEALITMRNRT